MKPDAKADNSPLKSLPEELASLVDSLAKDICGQKAPEEHKKTRRLVTEIFQRILGLGYRIEARVSTDSQLEDSAAVSPASQFMERLKASDTLNLSELLGIWNTASSEEASAPPRFYELLGSRILKTGEPILAYDVISRGLQLLPGDVRLSQLMALALARSGANMRANQILMPLYKQGHRDGETLGILARTHKALAEQAIDSSERNTQMRQAQSIYSEAYSLARDSNRLDDAIYTGINTASTALLTGLAEKAAETARNVRELCRVKLRSRKDYWAQASLGEAAVILGARAEAEEWYARAGETGRANFGDLSSTRRQARLLLDFLGIDKSLFDHCFEIPKIIVFAVAEGNYGRPGPLSFGSGEDVISRQMLETDRLFRKKIGYSGVTCRSDIIFLEHMVRHGSEINIVLPFPAAEFEKNASDIIPGPQWQDRFQNLLQKATKVVVSSEHGLWGSRVMYEYANMMRDGLAILRSRMLDTEVIPLVAVYGGAGCPEIEGWRRQGVNPVVLDLAGFVEEVRSLKDEVPEGANQIDAGRAEQFGDLVDFPQRIAFLLIADVAGYSSLKEELFPRFAEHFLGTVANLISQLPRAPLAKNTWGDAIYLVFSHIDDAGRFALDLLDRLSENYWGKNGSTVGLNLRIALHAGSVFTWTDPVTGQNSATGGHVVRAARIEPITPPGQVYASQAFAAIAAAEGINDFICDYVGEIPLAKKFGTYPTYHVRRFS